MGSLKNLFCSLAVVISPCEVDNSGELYVNSSNEGSYTQDSATTTSALAATAAESELQNVNFNNVISSEQLSLVLNAVQMNGGTLPDGSFSYEIEREQDGSISLTWRNSRLDEVQHLATFNADDSGAEYFSVSISTDFYLGTSRYSGFSLLKDTETPYGFFTDHHLFRFQDEEGRLILQEALSSTPALYQEGLSDNITLGQYPDINAENAIYVAQGMIAYTHPSSSQEFLVSAGAAPCVIIAIRNSVTGVTTMAHFDAATDIHSEIDKMYQSVSGQGGILEVHLAGGVAEMQRKFPSVALVKDIKEALNEYSDVSILTDLTGRELVSERLGINVRTGDIMTEFPYRYPPDYGIEDSQPGQFVMDQREFNLNLGFERHAGNDSAVEQVELRPENIRQSLGAISIDLSR